MLDLKKGDSVIVKGFTGIKLCVSTVKSATKKTLTVEKKNGDEMVFDRKTGKQINVEEGKEKYANSIMEDDGSYVAPSTAGAKNKKAAKKASKKAKVEEPEEEEEEEDEAEEEEVKPVKKAAKGKKAPAKKPAKKATKKVVVEEEEDDDDDDDYEDEDE